MGPGGEAAWGGGKLNKNIRKKKRKPSQDTYTSPGSLKTAYCSGTDVFRLIKSDHSQSPVLVSLDDSYTDAQKKKSYLKTKTKQN